MGNLSGKYDPNAEPGNDFSPFPTGVYTVQAIEGDVKPTKNNDGEFVEFTNEVLDGPLKGRRIWTRFNLDNPNPKAVETANRQLAEWRAAIGLDRADDTNDYLWKPYVIRVEFYPAGSVYASGKRKGQARERDESEVRQWKALEGAAPAAAPATQAPYARQPATPARGGWNPPKAA